MKSCKQKFQKKPVIVEAYQTDVELIIDLRRKNVRFSWRLDYHRSER